MYQIKKKRVVAEEEHNENMQELGVTGLGLDNMKTKIPWIIEATANISGGKKTLETIKELKKKIVQKHEEENLGRGSNNRKKNNKQKENNIKKNTTPYRIQYFSFY